MNEHDDTETQPFANGSATSRSKAGRITLAAAICLGLTTSGIVAASAASGSSSPTPTANSATSTAKRTPAKPGPHIDGTVKSVSGDVITVRDPDGFARTIDLTSNTSYIRKGAKATRSTVTVGRFVHAEGSVDSDGISLDATRITVSDTAPTPPAPPAIGAPGGPGKNPPPIGAKAGRSGGPKPPATCPAPTAGTSTKSPGSSATASPTTSSSSATPSPSTTTATASPSSGS